MNFTYHNKRVSGICVVLPANERSFVEEMRHYNFPEGRTLKLKEVMGYNKRRLVEPHVCVSDLAVFGLEEMFKRGWIAKEGRDSTPAYKRKNCVIWSVLYLQQEMMLRQTRTGDVGSVECRHGA